MALEGRTRRNIMLSKSINAMLLELSENKGLTMTAIVSIAIERYYREEYGNHKGEERSR